MGTPEKCSEMLMETLVYVLESDGWGKNNYETWDLKLDRGSHCHCWTPLHNLRFPLLPDRDANSRDDDNRMPMISRVIGVCQNFLILFISGHVVGLQFMVPLWLVLSWLVGCNILFTSRTEQLTAHWRPARTWFSLCQSGRLNSRSHFCVLGFRVRTHAESLTDSQWARNLGRKKKSSLVSCYWDLADTGSLVLRVKKYTTANQSACKWLLFTLHLVE